MDRLRRRDVFGADGCPAASGRYVVDGEVWQHSHDFLELVLVVDGEGWHETPAGRLPLHRGRLLSVRPGRWHGYHGGRRLDLFNLYLGPELLQRELAWVLDFPDLLRFLLRGGPSPGLLPDTAVEAVSDRLTELGRRDDPAGTPRAAVSLGLVSCALGEMAPALGGQDHGPTVSPVVRRAVALMTEDPQHPWSVPVLAGRLGVSGAHLHRRFAVELGTSPMAWLAAARVELAASLLIQDEATVAEIGRRVGWPDPSHFSRRFRHLTGTSPAATGTRPSVRARRTGELGTDPSPAVPAVAAGGWSDCPPGPRPDRPPVHRMTSGTGQLFRSGCRRAGLTGTPRRRGRADVRGRSALLTGQPR